MVPPTTCGSFKERGGDIEVGGNDVDGSTRSELSSSSGAPNLPRKLVRSIGTRAIHGIVLHAFRIHKEGELYACDDPYVGLRNALAAPSSCESDAEQDTVSYWIDIDADERDRDELNDWIKSLSLGTFITDQITRPAREWVSHVVSTRSKALVMIRILPAMNEDGSFRSTRLEYLAALKSKRMLLTYTTTQNGGGSQSLNQESIDYMTQDECLQDGSSSAAMIAWLEFHVYRTRKALEEIRTCSVELVKAMDTEPANVPLCNILQLRDRLLVVLSVAEEQAECLGMIRKMDKDTEGVDFKLLKGALSLVISTAESTERMGLRLEKRLSSLKQAFDSHQQDRMNRRLAVLTIVSAVFMPLTFMAGIYGMNFENIPELHYENAYFVLLSVMFAIATTMMFFFYHHGWFE